MLLQWRGSEARTCFNPHLQRCQCRATSNVDIEKERIPPFNRSPAVFLRCRSGEEDEWCRLCAWTLSAAICVVNRWDGRFTYTDNAFVRVQRRRRRLCRLRVNEVAFNGLNLRGALSAAASSRNNFRIYRAIASGPLRRRRKCSELFSMALLT